MTVKELFNKADKMNVLKGMAEQYGEDDEDGERYSLEIFEQILSIKPAQCPDDLIVCVRYAEWPSDEAGGRYMDASLYRKEDVAGKQIKTGDGDGERYVHGYSFELAGWPEILGTEVAHASLERYGLDACAQAIYHDMTFFGCRMEQREECIKEIRDRLLGTGNEVGSSRTFPVRDMWEELGTGLEPERAVTKNGSMERILEQNRTALNAILHQEKERLLKERLPRGFDIDHTRK